MTQGIILNGVFNRVADLPTSGRWGGLFFWSVNSSLPPVNHAVLRSYDGTAFVARVAPNHCRIWGNGSIPCVHLVGAGKNHANEGRVVFFIGTSEALAPIIDDKTLSGPLILGANQQGKQEGETRAAPSRVNNVQRPTPMSRRA